MGKATLVDITVMRHAETAKAVLVSNDGDEDGAVWIPKSQISIAEMDGKAIEISIPEWLAMDKGLC